MNETNEMWRGVKEARRKRLDDLEDFRTARFLRLLDEHPEIIMLRRLGRYGYRVVHYDRPQSQYVDFWPRTSAIRTWDGRSLKGFIKLKRTLGLSTTRDTQPGPTDGGS